MLFDEEGIGAVHLSSEVSVPHLVGVSGLDRDDEMMRMVGCG